MNKLPIKEKIEILQFCDENKHMSARKLATAFARKTGRYLSHTTVLRIIRQKAEILQSQTKQAKTIRIKKSIHIKFEQMFAANIDAVFKRVNVN